MIWIILGIIVWLFFGLISFLFLCAEDMRGKEFDKDYFKNDGYILASIFIIMLGIISFIIYIIYEFFKKINFTKLIYKICNIGVKKDKE